MKIHKSLRLLFVFTALMFLSLSVNAQTVNGKQKLLIIEGHFFNEIPVAKDLISKINIVSTPSGTKAMGLTLSKPLPEEALKYEIPKDKVKDADELLQRLKETKDNSMTISFNASETPLLKEGDAFPEFTATDINGKTWTNADVKGKVMVLNLWFTGCAPCRAEMPILSTWKDEMPDVMFFSSTYEDAEKAKPVLEQQKFNWIPLINDKQFKKYIGTKGYPLTVVVGKNGKIAKVEYGTSPVQREEVKKKIEELRK